MFTRRRTVARFTEHCHCLTDDEDTPTYSPFHCDNSCMRTHNHHHNINNNTLRGERMITFRIVLVVLLAAFTSCIAYSILSPLFRLTTLDYYGRTATTHYYYTHIDNGVQLPRGMWAGGRLSMDDLKCERMRLFCGWSFLLVIAAAVSGGLATAFGVTWVTMGNSAALHTVFAALTAIAFVCSTVVLGLMAAAYHRALCFSDSETSVSLSAAGFERAEGFTMLAVAMTGFGLATITQFVDFCCSCPTAEERCSVAQPDYAMSMKASTEEDDDAEGLICVAVKDELSFK